MKIVDLILFHDFFVIFLTHMSVSGEFDTANVSVFADKQFQWISCLTTANKPQKKQIKNIFFLLFAYDRFKV